LASTSRALSALLNILSSLGVIITSPGFSTAHSAAPRGRSASGLDPETPRSTYDGGDAGVTVDAPGGGRGLVPESYTFARGRGIEKAGEAG
jgi:hypothetical protein